MHFTKSNVQKKYRMAVAIFIAALLASGLVTLPFGGSGASGAVVDAAAGGRTYPIEIFLNGMRLESDVPPIIKDDRTFVPIRVIGEALGYDVDYEDGIVNMQHKGSGATVNMEVGVPSATINGQLVDLPVPAFIESGRTLAPVRFLSEALGSRVDWIDGYGEPDKVVIYSPYPINVGGGKAQIASRSESKFWEYENEYFGTVSIGYDISIPIFTISGKENFARELNDHFSTMMNNYIDEINKVHSELTSDESEGAYGYSEGFSFSIIYDDEHVLTLSIEGYSYYGGAHGMPYNICYNLDLDQGKKLTIADIFKPGIDYEGLLIQRMILMNKNMPEEYEDVNDPDYIDDDYFYFDDGDLVLFYPPYELSFYARGFVEYRIPLNYLAEYIRDEYK